MKEELEAYAKGFKDGWEAARKEFEPGWGKNKNHLQPHMWRDLSPETYKGCSVCGRSGIDNYVCYLQNCPSKVSCQTGAGAIGAPVNVGVGGIGTISPATNGPTGEWK